MGNAIDFFFKCESLLKNIQIIFKNKITKNESEKTVIVELGSEVLFLPSYFSKIMSEDDIKNINIDGETKYFPSVLLK